MPSHLLISVTFLQPTCHARLGKEEAAPNEWPPSPLRLFQAMVAGAAARWAGDDGSTRAALTAEAPVAALKWLESLCASSPPTILAPRAVTGQAVPRYVPNNSADLVAAKWARGDALAAFEDRTKKVFRPTHLLDGSTVHYLWPLTDDQRREAGRYEPTIASAARCIVALGWGIDAAIGDARLIDDSEAVRLTGERWTPGRVGTPGLRVPVRGTLDALIDRHAKFLDRLKDGVFHPVPPLRAFTTAAYRRASDLPDRPFAAFLLRPLHNDTGYAAFAATRAACVAAMLRHAACETAKADLDNRPGAWRTGEWALRFVAGHGPEGSPKRRDKHDAHPRFSYLPLPSIGHRHADGMIRRAIIAEPFGGDGRSARWASRRLAGAILHDEERGPVARLEPVDPDEAEFARVFRLYAACSYNESACVWTSVTPVILPGYDDNKPAKRDRLLLDCLAHAGIDAACVACIESRPAAWPVGGGAAPALPDSAYRRPKYLQHLPACHVRIRFRAAVAGPVALGAGRHCGLGLFAVCPRERTAERS
ncbi:MAG: type I-U CRISPR-associated protein Cas5/Cas6 [Phycisphaerae bacterium]|jgi:CRISPR-associated protein Csb2